MLCTTEPIFRRARFDFRIQTCQIFHLLVLFRLWHSGDCDFLWFTSNLGVFQWTIKVINIFSVLCAVSAYTIIISMLKGFLFSLSKIIMSQKLQYPRTFHHYLSLPHFNFSLRLHVLFFVCHWWNSPKDIIYSTSNYLSLILLVKQGGQLSFRYSYLINFQFHKVLYSRF